MQIAHTNFVFREVIREVFCHALGERRHQHPLIFGGTITNLSQQVIHLSGGGPHLNNRIQHPSGTNHLFRNLTFTDLHLPVTGSCAHEHGLLGLAPKFLRLQRTVISGTRQTEAMVNQHLFAGLIAVVHRQKLRAGHMAFIHD